MLFKKPKWPAVNFEELRKRSRLLVIDDQDFPYKTLFERDGYLIEKWDDIEDLSKLESGFYDVILLDLQGVGQEDSVEQGLGVLRHLRKTSPAQIIIAYSMADWPLRYQDFFKMADAVLSKNADYVEFKEIVDEHIKRRFSLDYYLLKIQEVIKGKGDLQDEILPVARDNILKQSPEKLKKYLKRNVSDPVTIDTIMSFANIAIGVMQICMRLS